MESLPWLTKVIRSVLNGRFAALSSITARSFAHVLRPKLSRRWRASSVLRKTRFLPIYRSSRNPYDRGDLSPHDYWTEFARRAGVTIHEHQIGNLRRLDMGMWSDVNKEMTEWLARVHSHGVETAILSNMQTDMAAHVRNSFGWLRHFDHQVFSCEVRSVKPDSFIYEHTLSLLKIPPSEALFIDDREENIHAARAAGIVGIIFESVSHLRGELQKLGFPILPASSSTDDDSSR